MVLHLLTKAWILYVYTDFMQGAERGVAVVQGIPTSAHCSPEVSKGEEIETGHAGAGARVTSSWYCGWMPWPGLG